MEDKIVTLGRLAAWCELKAAKPGLDDYERRMYLARAKLYRDRQFATAQRVAEVVEWRRKHPAAAQTGQVLHIIHRGDTHPC